MPVLWKTSRAHVSYGNENGSQHMVDMEKRKYKRTVVPSFVTSNLQIPSMKLEGSLGGTSLVALDSEHRSAST